MNVDTEKSASQNNSDILGDDNFIDTGKVTKKSNKLLLLILKNSNKMMRFLMVRIFFVLEPYK